MPTLIRSTVVTTLTLMLGAGLASAQNSNRWLVIAPGEPILALDTTTMTKSADGLPRVWLRFTYKTPRGTGDKQYVTELWRVDINCTKRQISYVTTINYSAHGDVVSSIQAPYTAWNEVVPDTTGEEAVNGFCKSFYSRL